ncbi:PREDICTED: E3 ubiquitin-protein ligase ATL6-like [Ipomoea nil]|uniref:E3 ubiquitin-protein ligase ATL6-like n=1 Tax=Ipomoea nil TaxID=35883 RepID=UPI000901411C|nr:PREDICTED: E3 ubiquitin-protein ligase ATL6-like [Ipomoea nil]
MTTAQTHSPAFSANDNTDEENRPFYAVCLNGICDDEKCRKLSECEHCFHVNCVDAWPQNHSTCQLYRAQVSDHIFRQECEGGVLDLFVSWSQIVFVEPKSPIMYCCVSSSISSLRSSKACRRSLKSSPTSASATTASSPLRLWSSSRYGRLSYPSSPSLRRRCLRLRRPLWPFSLYQSPREESPVSTASILCRVYKCRRQSEIPTLPHI